MPSFNDPQNRVLPDPERPWIDRLPTTPPAPFPRPTILPDGPTGGWLAYWVTVDEPTATYESRRWDYPTIHAPASPMSPVQRRWVTEQHQQAGITPTRAPAPTDTETQGPHTRGGNVDQRPDRGDLQAIEATPEPTGPPAGGDQLEDPHQDIAHGPASEPEPAVAPAASGRAGRPPGRAEPAPSEGSELTHESPHPTSDHPPAPTPSPTPGGETTALGKTRTAPPPQVSDPGQLVLPGFSAKEVA